MSRAHVVLAALVASSALACREPRASEPAPTSRAPSPASSAASSARPSEPAAHAPSAAPAPTAPSETPLALEPGLSVRWYFVGEPMEKVLPLVPGQTPNVSRVVQRLDLEDKDVGSDIEDTFVTHVTGFLTGPVPGKYVLRLISDDGSKLWLDRKLVIDHDGLHSPQPKDAEVELEGRHALEIQHFECYGGSKLRLEWKKPGDAGFELVPTSALSCQAGEVRVTSPGPKRVIRPLAKGRPGDGMPLDAVNPCMKLATIRPDGFEPKVAGLAFLGDGRLAVTTWDPVGAVWFLDGVETGDASKVHAHRFAAGLAEPLGICIVGERIFVVQKQELTELVDHDKDGVCDEYRCVNGAWDVTANFHEFTFGLVEKDGWLYFNLALAIDPGGRSTRPQVPHRGSVVRVEIATGKSEFVASGLRTPNGIGLGPNGTILITDNQGDWLPSSKLLVLAKDAFYGSRSVLLDAAKDLPVTPPALWLPQGEIGNSPSQPALVPDGWGPFSGQVVHGDVTYGGIERDALEQIDGVWQGCVVPWTQGLEAGVNRIVFGPDHALYVGGIGSTGDWGQEGKKRFGLQRLAYSGKPAFEILAVRAKSDGFDVELTQPLADGIGWDREGWSVEQWRYVPTEQYGGPKVDEKTLDVRSASVSEDRKHVFLEIAGLENDHVVHVHALAPLTSASGERLVASEAWYTLNRVPKDRPGAKRPAPPEKPHDVLSDAEKKAGWKLLFDGRSLEQWHNFKKSGPVQGWTIADGAFTRTGDGGDLVTNEEYADFELTLQWKISKGGNSGILFHVGDDHGYVWETGPEMQVLDDDGHPDGQNPLTSAGANYALHAPPRDVTRPVGMWNDVRLVVKGAHVEHWLNGEKVVEYELWTPEWKALVAASKFASMPEYGLKKTGRIALQDHGDRVSYRDVKIRRL